MKSRPIVATTLVLLTLAAALPVAHAGPLGMSFQINGNQLTLTLYNPGSEDVTVAVTVYQQGQSLGTQVVTVPAGGSVGTVWSINDDLNPFDLYFSAIPQS